MCLVIDKSIKPLPVNKNGFCTGYKIVNLLSNRSTDRGYEYCRGENVSDRCVKGRNCRNRRNCRNPLLLSKMEKKTGTVDHGFHVILKKKEAIRFAALKLSGIKIIKVLFKPEDVVEYGRFNYCRDLKMVVVTKLVVNSLTDVREKR